MHKTEGSAYRRINVNASAKALSERERAYLDELGKNVVFAIDVKKASLFLNLLENVVSADNDTPSEKLADSFLHVLLFLLKQDCLQPLQESVTIDNTSDRNVAMQTVAYIHDHFFEEFSIQDLCEKFFISKNVLCLKFKKLMHCSIMQYRQFIRISKAKELLSSTKKSVAEISQACGFSSENYFSLIFKHEVGLSPTNYRKAK